MKPEQAQTIALNILTFLVSEPERAEAFLRATGMEPNEIRERASDRQFLAGIVDYILSDEQLLISFANDQEIKPDAIWTVRRALPGGQIDF
jgi:hypothetical protein